jgi:3-hydroxyisobutyrate dehydrogenase-like beta-hydroxyacid dehydrogenase
MKKNYFFSVIKKRRSFMLNKLLKSIFLQVVFLNLFVSNVYAIDKKVCIIGLGAMGTAYANRLLDQGYTVYGYDKFAANKKDLFDKMSLTHPTFSLVDSVGVMSDKCKQIMSATYDESTLQSVLDELKLTKDHTLISFETISPTFSIKKANNLEKNTGAKFLDTPVSGGPQVAEKGELSVIAAGDKDGFKRVEHILNQLGRNGKAVDYVGKNGMALTLKIGINSTMVAYLNAFSEGISYAVNSGVSREDVVDYLLKSDLASDFLVARREYLLRPSTLKTLAPVTLLQKDLNLGFKMAKDIEGLEVMKNAFKVNTIFSECSDQRKKNDFSILSDVIIELNRNKDKSDSKDKGMILKEAYDIVKKGMIDSLVEGIHFVTKAGVQASVATDIFTKSSIGNNMIRSNKGEQVFGKLMNQIGKVDEADLKKRFYAEL